LDPQAQVAGSEANCSTWFFAPQILQVKADIRSIVTRGGGGAVFNVVGWLTGLPLKEPLAGRLGASGAEALLDMNGSTVNRVLLERLNETKGLCKSLDLDPHGRIIRTGRTNPGGAAQGTLRADGGPAPARPAHFG
jgi:hypothetical protein